MIEGVANPDTKEYLAWFAKHYGKDSHFTIQNYFDIRNIDLFICENKQWNTEVVENLITTEDKEEGKNNTRNAKQA